jgi:hypothetical protein
MIGFSVQAIERMSRLTGGGPRLRPYHGEGVLSGPGVHREDAPRR